MSEGVLFNLNDLNPGTWFDYENGSRVCLRVCAVDDTKNIRKQTTKKKIEFKNNQRVIYDEVNEELESQLVWDFCIVDWEKFFDSRGNSIPCNKEMKLLLMGKSLKFSNFVNEKIKILADLVSENAEDEIKN
jgi:hypothetical protein